MITANKNFATGRTVNIDENLKDVITYILFGKFLYGFI